MWFVVLEEYEKSNAAQLPIAEIETDKKHGVSKFDSILLQKIENNIDQRKSKNEQKPTHDTILSVIYIN